MINDIWGKIINEGAHIKKEEYFHEIISEFVLGHNDYQNALIYLLKKSINKHQYYYKDLEKSFINAFGNNENLIFNSLLDITAFVERDPACKNYCEAFLFYKGFKALQLYRIANYYWNNSDYLTARLLQSIISDIFCIDIHPAAELSGGIFIDHGTGIVIGETAKIDKNVSILQNVTLGGTGKDLVDRHPKIGEGVLIGAGAKILGNISIGKNSRIGAGSIVLKNVPENVTVVGIPAKVISKNLNSIPAKEMNQTI